MEGVWGDLLCNYVMSLFLGVPYMVISPSLTWDANQHLSNRQKNPMQYDIVVVYNNHNHYCSTSKVSHFNYITNLFSYINVFSLTVESRNKFVKSP